MIIIQVILQEVVPILRGMYVISAAQWVIMVELSFDSLTILFTCYAGLDCPMITRMFGNLPPIKRLVLHTHKRSYALSSTSILYSSVTSIAIT